MEKKMTAYVSTLWLHTPFGFGKRINKYPPQPFGVGVLSRTLVALFPRERPWPLAAAAARKGPPPAPVAPPLPFRYQGKLMEEGGITVFLAQGDRILPARAGDLLNNQYRVESVTAAAITFMFEPLKQRQTLTIGSAP